MVAAGTRPPVEPVDPFELPSWIGEEPVTWMAQDSLGASHLVAGTLSGPTDSTPCDVLAGDHAYPDAALEGDVRREMHQSWMLGQVLVVTYGERMTRASPGRVVDAEMALESLRRFAKAVGATQDRMNVTLRL